MRYIKMIWFVVFFAVGSSAFSEEDMVAKAWSCDPSFTSSVDLNGFVSMKKELPDIFQFGKCNELSEEDKNVLRGALLKEYGEESHGEWHLVRFILVKDSKRIERNRAEAEERRKSAETAKAEALKAKEDEKQARIQQLRAGTVKAENMKDIWLANNNQIPSLQEIMASALLRADNGVYGGRVTIDGEFSEGVLRVKFESDVLRDIAFQTPEQADANASEEEMARAVLRGRALSQSLSRNGTIHYAQLNLRKGTVLFTQNLRIGSVVWVVGQYKANRKYKLVNRTERTMPVLDVFYLGE